MPTYDYRCPHCGKFTISQGIKEKALGSCPTCGAPVHRLIGKNVNIIFKCSGFYSTDTRSPAGTPLTPASENPAAATNETDNNVKRDTSSQQKAETAKNVEAEKKTESNGENKTERKAVNE